MRNRNVNISISIQISTWEGTDIMVLAVPWTADSCSTGKGNSTFVWSWRLSRKFMKVCKWALFSLITFLSKILTQNYVHISCFPTLIFKPYHPVDLITQNISVNNKLWSSSYCNFLHYHVISQPRQMAVSTRNYSFTRGKKNAAIWSQHCLWAKYFSTIAYSKTCANFWTDFLTWGITFSSHFCYKHS
jgi:hypothetical protein